MILRRLSNSLKEQNWAAIWIEFVLLVVGVFLGIQVANWNEERVERRESAAFTARLKADLIQESWRYQFLIEYSRDVRAAAQKAADTLAGKLTLSNEAFLISAYRASQYKQGFSRRATYDQLISTGKIGLIADDTLLNTATRAYSITTIDELVREGVNSRYRQWFRMHIDTGVQQALAKQCGDRYINPGEYAGMGEVLDYPCSSDLPASAIDTAVETLRADPRALQFLRLRIADLGTRLVDLTDNNRDVYEWLKKIAEDAP